jgi:hypothetical protein
MSEGKETEELALEHAWKWFEYHASQRMTMIRFYLTVAGAIATGAGYLWVAKEYMVSAILCTFGVIASLSFMRLDKRVSNLIKLGEDSLKVIQKRFSDALGAPPFEICHLADDNKIGGKRKFAYPYSYGENFRLLFVLATITFFVMLLLNLSKLPAWFG